MVNLIEEVISAYSKGMITSEQVSQAISGLPCFGDLALRPGVNGYYGPGENPCVQARRSRGLTEIKGTHPIVPNNKRILPEACTQCPEFGPALPKLFTFLE